MNTPVSVEAQALLAAAQNERHTWETVGKAAAASVDVQWVGYNTIDVIAEELSKARAQNARLRAALEPFAEVAKHWRVDYLTWGDLRKAKAALAETPAESLEVVRAEAATSGARNLAAAFHRAVKAAAPDITYPEPDEPLESAVAYIFAQIRAESKSEARREMAEIVAKLVPELRAYIRDGMAAFDTTVDDAVISALDRFRAEAGRERAVRELRIVAERWFREVAAARRLPGPFNSIGEEFGRELFARAEEIAKEGK